MDKILGDNILILHYYLTEKIRHGISSELSARQTIHVKYQSLFSLKNIWKITMSSAAAVTSSLRVNILMQRAVLCINIIHVSDAHGACLDPENLSSPV